MVRRSPDPYFTPGPRERTGATLRGLPVLGGVEALPEVVRRHRIEMVVVVPADLDG